MDSKIEPVAWADALKCAETALRNMPDDYGDLTVEVQAIYAALLAAEQRGREVAAQIADREAERHRLNYANGKVLLDHYYETAAINVAAAIRKESGEA